MPVQVTCKCGKVYNFKDEFIGKIIECPNCLENIKVNPPAGYIVDDPIFSRDKFLLRQKHLAINEKYYVCDEKDKPLLFVERPAYMFKQLLALFGGIIAAILVWIILGAITAQIKFEPIKAGFAMLTVFAGLFTIFAVSITLAPKRHVIFFSDDTKSKYLLRILQDKKFQFMKATYTLLDTKGQVLAKFRKNYFYNLFRKRWECCAPSDQVLFIAQEDSIILSLLRRVLGSFYGLLRTNFIYCTEDEETVLGEFNRKMTILDKYVLDLSADPGKRIDRRVGLALGVLLDTGERR
ncbi:MAG: hypothetical protein PHV60_04105 [bacterium]|nr:hypothetical protein [bacterium]